MKTLFPRTALFLAAGRVLRLAWILPFCLAVSNVWAQTAPITSSGLNTQISGPTAVESATQYDITGGTRPGDGTNLFHSFGVFNVPSDTIANFLNETGLPTNNILARVTGGQSSIIFGTLQTTGFGNANLFLMNPAGIVFGPSASLNVGGSVAFTTADYLRLDNLGGDNSGIFHANSAQTSLLSTAPVSAFGFLGTNPGTIAIQGSQLTVREGESFSLVGGDLTILSDAPNNGAMTQPTYLSAPGGQINLVSVDSPGEVISSTLQTDANVSGQSSSTMGHITVSGNSVLSVSGDPAGTIKIRGGQLVITDGTLSADTGDANGASSAVDIQLTGGLSISNDLAPAITARTMGFGNAGAVTVESSNMTAISNTMDILSLIDTQTWGEGTAGNVNITTGDLQIIGSPLGFSGFIDTGTLGPGSGGDITITAKHILMDSSLITSGSFWANLFGMNASGTAGNVTIHSDSLHLLFAGIDTGAGSFFDPTIGQAGDITIHSSDIQLSSSLIQTQGMERGGTIAVEAHHVSLTDSRLETQTGHTDGGGISITTKSLDLTQGSQLISTTGGDGDAGAIYIDASEHVGILEGSRFVRPSGIFTQSFGTSGSSGNAGDITIITPQLQLTEGGRINSVTQSSGQGGNVTIHAGTISMSGEFPDEISEPLFNLGPIHQSGIFTLTVGGNCVGLCGNAGSISITAASLTMGHGAQIDSGTRNSGNGGNITVKAANQVVLSGTLSDSSPVGVFSRSNGTAFNSGTGGDISLTAGQSVTIRDGASISATSTGPGNAGNIWINAGRQLTVQDSSITTEATQASGGNIDIRAIDLVRLFDHGVISTSVLGGDGTGGNITIDPNAVILQSGQILAQAIQGSGGNITITTPVFLADQFSLVSASSQFGLDGTVTIQSPISNLSGTVGRLTAQTSPPQSLLHNRCVALAGSEQSSFVLAGRDAASTDPGGWLSSPMMSAAIESDKPTTDTATRTLKQGASQTALLHGVKPASFSLRHLTPPGFLVRAFALDGSTGCRS